jgi:hypothetical protein
MLNFGDTPMYVAQYAATIVGIVIGSSAIIAVVVSIVVSRMYPGDAAIGSQDKGVAMNPLVDALPEEPEDFIPSPDGGGGIISF